MRVCVAHCLLVHRSLDGLRGVVQVTTVVEHHAQTHDWSPLREKLEGISINSVIGTSEMSYRHRDKMKRRDGTTYPFTG